jgi:hypothetical protein
MCNVAASPVFREMQIIMRTEGSDETRGGMTDSVRSPCYAVIAVMTMMLKLVVIESL